jgi:hypothetical protein
LHHGDEKGRKWKLFLKCKFGKKKLILGKMLKLKKKNLKKKQKKSPS